MKKFGPWTQIDTKEVYKNNWITVTEDNVIRPDGKAGVYGIVNVNAESIAVVAVNEQNEIYLIKQYRYALKKDSWEVICGGSDQQDPEIAAQRELKEETGLEAKSFIKVGEFNVLNGVSNNIMHVFLAQGFVQTNHNEQNEEGIIECKTFPFSKVLEMIENKEIHDGESMLAIFHTAMYLGYVQIN